MRLRSFLFQALGPLERASLAREIPDGKDPMRRDTALSRVFEIRILCAFLIRPGSNDKSRQDDRTLLRRLHPGIDYLVQKSYPLSSCSSILTPYVRYLVERPYDFGRIVIFLPDERTLASSNDGLTVRLLNTAA